MSSHASNIRRGLVFLAAAVFLVSSAWEAATVQAQETAVSPQESLETVESYRDIPTETLFKRLRAAFDATSAAETEKVLTLRFVRDDVFLVIEGNEVPASAGIEHTFHFYRCPCGTILTHGSFVLRDYEVNDVMDTLRENPKIKIVGMGAFLLGENPRLTLLRFQGEGHDDELAKSLNAAFRWIGEARSQPMEPQRNTDERG